MPSAVSVRSPAREELPICRMLLPCSIPDAKFRHFRLAFDPDGRIAGAASFLETSTSLDGIQVASAPGENSSEAEQVIVEELVREAFRRGKNQLSASTHEERDAYLQQLLISNGFQVATRFVTVEAELGAGLDYGRSIRTRVQMGPSGPAPMEVVPLSPSNVAEAGRLYAAYISNIPELAAARLRLGADLPRFGLTQVLLVNRRVAGLMLIEKTGSVAVIHARVVHREYRGGRASAVLVGTAMERLHQAGITKLRFQFFDSISDTMKVSKRLKARETECVNRLLLSLTKGS